MSKAECPCRCQNEECARFHNPPKPPCNCIRQISKSTKFIERILACTDAVVRVLGICGIHECKAKAAAEVIVYAFLYFDIIRDPVSDIRKKKIRKEDLFHDLGRKCRMNRVEAHLAYVIIKKAFKAFYYKQNADVYNPDVIDEFQWMLAAKGSADVHATSEGMPEIERKKLENRIKCAYCSYIRRVQAVREKLQQGCTCCFCSKCKTFAGSGYKVYARGLPTEDKDAYEFRQRLIQEGKMHAESNRDYCGLDILKWQTQMKSAGRCKCGEKPPISCCGCEPITIPGNINVDWQTAPVIMADFTNPLTQAP